MDPSLRSGLKTKQDTSTDRQFAKAHCKLGSGQKTKKESTPDTSAASSINSEPCLSMTETELVLQKLTAIEDLLKQSQQAGMPSANDDRAYRLADKPLTFKEACTYLGYAPSYLYKLTYQKKIPHYKPTGKVIFFSKHELNEWIFSSSERGRQNVELETEDGSASLTTRDPNQIEMNLSDPSLRQNNGGQIRSGHDLALAEERWIEFPLKSRRKAE